MPKKKAERVEKDGIYGTLERHAEKLGVITKSTLYPSESKEGGGGRAVAGHEQKQRNLSKSPKEEGRSNVWKKGEGRRDKSPFVKEKTGRIGKDTSE